MKHRRTHPLFVFVVIAALLLGACSSGGDDAADDDTVEATADGGDETTTTEDDGGDETTTTEESGDGGGAVDVGSDGEAYVSAMVESMQADEDFPLSDEQAECFSSRFVDTIGVDRLQEAGVTPEQMASDDESMEFTELDLSLDEGNELYDHFGDCGIDLHEIMMSSMSEDEDMTPEMQACMEAVLTEENLRAFMVIGMTEGDDAIETDPAAAEFMSGLMGCAFMGMDSGDMDIEGLEPEGAEG